MVTGDSEDEVRRSVWRMANDRLTQEKAAQLFGIGGHSNIILIDMKTLRKYNCRYIFDFLYSRQGT